MTNPIHQSLQITICGNPADAIARGYNYSAQPNPPKPIEVTEVVVVRNGTQEGNPTVDFILRDETGQRFVFMVTGRLLKTIPC